MLVSYCDQIGTVGGFIPFDVIEALSMNGADVKLYYDFMIIAYFAY